MNESFRILYVEDSPFDREIVAAALHREGLNCKFVYAATEKDFREALNNFQFDLILSDFTLPSYSGAAALTLTKAIKPDVPFLFLSDAIHEELAAEQLRRGATDYVFKDHLERLGPTVRRALREAQEHTERLLRSRVNSGTTFKNHPPATRAVSTEKRIQGGTETILVVEDELPLRQLVCRILENYGYCILQADSSQAALKQWEKHQERIDLLLTDLIIPGGLNGRQLAETLCATNPTLKVVFSSGYATEIAGPDFQLHEGINFLQKPFVPRALAQCVRSCLDSPRVT